MKTCCEYQLGIQYYNMFERKYLSNACEGTKMMNSLYCIARLHQGIMEAVEDPRLWRLTARCLHRCLVLLNLLGHLPVDAIKSAHHILMDAEGSEVQNFLPLAGTG